MKRLIPFSAVFFLLLLTMIFNCFALQMPISNEELIRESRDIIHGIVGDLKSGWADNHSFIYTYATIQVLDVYKGEAGDEMILQIPGGTIKNQNADEKGTAKDKLNSDSLELYHFRGGGGDTSLVVSDEAELKVGIEIIIHTYLTENGILVIHSGERGVYNVKNGVVEQLNMTLDQYKNLVDEVMKKK